MIGLPPVQDAVVAWIAAGNDIAIAAECSRPALNCERTDQRTMSIHKLPTSELQSFDIP